MTATQATTDATDHLDSPVHAPPADVGRSAEEIGLDIDGKLLELEQLAESLQQEGQAGQSAGRLAVPAGFLLSVVVPVYNEEKTVRGVLEKLLDLPLPAEIIVVDDGSTDGTANAIMEMGDVPGVRVILKPKNEGKGSALRAGFDRARGDVIMVQDADFEYDPSDIPNLLRPILEDEADVVYGSRFKQGQDAGSSAIHRFGNRALTAISNFTTGLRLTDMETCYKLFRREALDGLALRQDRFGFEPEITAKVARRRFRIKELPIQYNPRGWDEGKKIGIKDGFSAIYCILRYAWAD